MSGWGKGQISNSLRSSLYTLKKDRIGYRGKKSDAKDIKENGRRGRKREKKRGQSVIWVKTRKVRKRRTIKGKELEWKDGEKKREEKRGVSGLDEDKKSEGKNE